MFSLNTLLYSFLKNFVNNMDTKSIAACLELLMGYRSRASGGARFAVIPADGFNTLDYSKLPLYVCANTDKR